MKNKLVLLSLLLAIILAGCASAPKYVVVTTDYAVHIAKTQPVVDPDADTISFQDETGQVVSLPKEDLKRVKTIGK